MATPLNDVYSLRAATDAELHIAVVHGPHAGMVLPASAAALRVRDVGSVNGLWLRCGGCFWRRRRRLVWYPRARIRIGTTVLQLRRLPRQLQVPQPHAGGFLLQSLYVLLPLVAMAGFLLTDQGWSMMLISAPMLGLMMLRSYPSGRGASPGRLPDPATLALASINPIRKTVCGLGRVSAAFTPPGFAPMSVLPLPALMPRQPGAGCVRSC